VIDDDGIFRRGPRRAPSTPRPASPKPRPRPAARDDRPAISRMLDAARPSGRLPALVVNDKTSRMRRYAEKWRAIVDASPTGESAPTAPAYEPSRYTGSDDEEDT